MLSGVDVVSKERHDSNNSIWFDIRPIIFKKTRHEPYALLTRHVFVIPQPSSIHASEQSGKTLLLKLRGLYPKYCRGQRR